MAEQLGTDHTLKPLQDPQVTPPLHLQQKHPHRHELSASKDLHGINKSHESYGNAFHISCFICSVFSHDHPLLIFIVIQNVRGWETGRSTFLAL